MKHTTCFGLLLALLGYLLFPGPASAAIPAEEREALIALYNSTNGDSWSDNSGWKSGDLAADGFALPGTEGSWFGVVVTGGTVTEIILLSNNLMGTLPAELGNLTSLHTLDLYDNQLTGSIPTQLDKLANLQILYLDFNQLIGDVPAELGSLANLQNLWLNNNQLAGSIPTQLGNLANLQNLYLDNNWLSGSIPKELGNLANLQFLYLDNNWLSGGIPAELGDLSKLEELWLNDNELSGSIPQQLMNLVNLINNRSDFRWNHLFTTDDDLRNFLNSKQIGGDWESYQTPPFIRTMPWIPLLLLDDGP